MKLAGPSTPDPLSAATFFSGPGEVRELCRGLDWPGTPLGPVNSWPLSLRATVKNLLASRHPMFLFWGPDLVQFYNDAYRPSLGSDGRHVRALGARGSEFWTEIWHAIGPQIDQVMGGGESTWHADQYLPIFRNGQMEDVFWTYSYGPAHDDDGCVAGVLVVCQETTSQVEGHRAIERLLGESERAREDADAARREADAANRGKGEFLAMLSHELRTPLAAISGYAELLSMNVGGGLSDAQLKYVERIQHSQQHVLGLIDGLLLYAQVEAGKLQYQMAEVTLADVLSSCEELTAPMMQSRQLTFEMAALPGNLKVVADLEKTRQIVVNLLGNAIKFTKPGGTVSVNASSDGTQWAHIAVRDSGVGISEQDLSRIFDPFVRLNAGDGPDPRGTGLGLAISLTFARAMGGALTVESKPGAGSTFTLTLPIAPAR